MIKMKKNIEWKLFQMKTSNIWVYVVHLTDIFFKFYIEWNNRKLNKIYLVILNLLLSLNCFLVLFFPPSYIHNFLLLGTSFWFLGHIELLVFLESFLQISFSTFTILNNQWWFILQVVEHFKWNYMTNLSFNHFYILTGPVINKQRIFNNLDWTI